jgi:hypothetical protein
MMPAMCDKELIVGYLYDELSASDRQTVDAHVAACPECRIELEELRATRMHLALWAPPEPELGFRVIRGAAAAQPLPRRWLPALGLAAAAVLVLAAAASLANIEVRYGNEGMTVRTGWGRQLQGGVAEGGGVATSDRLPEAPASVATGEFEALDRRLQEIEVALASGEPDAGVQTVSENGLSDAELLRRVRQMVNEAEARQETAFARRLLQVVRDVDNQRRADMALIQQGLAQYQGLTNAEIAQNRDMVSQLVRAATRQEK